MEHKTYKIDIFICVTRSTERTRTNCYSIRVCDGERQSLSNRFSCQTALCVMDLLLLLILHKLSATRLRLQFFSCIIWLAFSLCRIAHLIEINFNCHRIQKNIPKSNKKLSFLLICFKLELIFSIRNFRFRI